MLSVHVDVPVFSCFVLNKFFYNGNQVEKQEFTKCDVFAISSYQNMVPSFVVRIRETGAIFHNIPIHAMFVREELSSQLNLEDLVYHNCPDYSIVVNKHIFLEGRVKCFFVKKNTTLEGNYCFTVDWFKSNENLHFIALDNGQFCFLPNHKILFRSNLSELPKYEKAKHEFRV